MTAKRTRHRADFKAKVALDAVRGAKTLGELRKEHSVHSTQISEWKRQLLAGIRDIFGTRRDKETSAQQALQASLYE